MSKFLQQSAAMLICLLVSFSLNAQTQTLRLKPLVSSDDAEQNTTTGAVQINSSDLELGGYDWNGAYKQSTGIRFPNVTLPQGTTITKAYIQFSVDELYAAGNTANITIKAQKGNAATYAASANNISSRTYTTANITWSITAWTVIDQRLAAQQTPDLKALITEATQIGFVSGNALAFCFTTTVNGYTTSYAVDRGAANAPELVIEYTTAAPLSISADKASGTYYEPFNVALTGTAGSTIRYTTDGSTPTATTGLVYSAPIVVSATSTIKAIAVSGTSVSSVLILNYTIAPLSIAANVASGKYFSPFALTLSSVTGATIRYTTDGSMPTATTGTVYSASIQVSTATTIKAISVLNTAISGVLTLNYTFETLTNITTKRFKITASSDDAEENIATGAVTLNSSDLESGGFDYGANYTQIAAVRFSNIALPANATITKAYIQFSAKEASQTPLANIDIKIQNTINAATFAATAKNITSRTFTSGKTVWNTQKWLLANDRTPLQQSSDIANLIKEAMAVGGWNANMSFVFTLGSATSGWANAFSFDGSAAGAPELVIEYGEKPIEKTLLTNVFINEGTGSSSAANKLDWVEIFNNNTNVVSLDSVYVTDDKKVPNKFMFKGKVLGAKSFVVVNADDTLTVSNATTAAFGISAKGETVYLFQHFNGVLYQIDSLNIGATEFNNSYGRFPDASANIIRFATLTPSVSNNNSKQLVDLTFSNQRGIYTSPFNLSITAPAGMTIKYTTNSTTPNATNGTTYTAPIPVSANMVIRVYAYGTAIESRVITQTYVFPATTSQQLALPTADVEKALKDLPIISLSTTADIRSTTQSGCTFEYINKFGENKSVFVDAGFNIFGNVSAGQAKQNLRVYFKSIYGYNKLKHSIFEKAAGQTYNPTDEFDALDLKVGQDVPYSTALGDYLAHGLIRKAGAKDIHVSYANVFVNGAYFGLFPVREKFDNDYAPAYFGGSDTDYDYMSTTDIWYNWPTQGQFFANTGTLTQFTGMIAANTARNYQDLKKKLDVEHFTNNMLVFMAGGAEPELKAIVGKGYNPRTIFNFKDTDCFMDDVKSTGANIGQQSNLTGNSKGPMDLFVMTGMGGGAPVLEYQTLAKDRLQILYLEKNGCMTADSVNAFYRYGQNLIKSSMPLEIARWKYYTLADWNNRINLTTTNMPTRIQNVINLFSQNKLMHTLKAPTFSKASGSLNIGEKIYLTNPNAGSTVYYTTDGTDVVLDNAVSITAKLYNATTGIDLPLGKTKIRARAFTTGNFGMYADAEYVVARPIKITAIAYQPNPAAPAAEPKGSDAYEFFNLTNIGTLSVDVSNFMVTEAIDTFRLPVGTSIAGGETIMLCSDSSKYPSVQMRKFKFPKGKLANDGENISFKDNLGNLVNEVKYDTLAPWPYAKGNGLYIRLKSLTADNSKGANWEAVPLTDLNPPILLQNVANFTAIPQNNTAILNWSLPTTAFDEILIVAKEAESITTKPDAAATYTADANFTGAGAAFGGGKVVFKGITGSSVTVTNLNYAKTYYFRAFTKKGSVYTEGVEIIASTAPICDASGQLLCEIWNNIGAGNCVTDIPVATAPTKSQVQALAVFESTTNQAENFGARYRGYICAPESGNYTFYIASDDGGELWLSTDANPANKRKIAFMPNCSWTTSRNWGAFVEQKSVSIALVAGQKYYVEALYKEGAGGDNLAIGWQTPSNTAIDVVPGSILSPFVTTVQNLQNAYIFTSEGQQEGQKGIIHWVSSANRQADYYVVEKLEADKANFEKLEIVNAQYSNQSNALQYYTITDNAPKKGVVLYRVGVVLEGQATPQYLEPISLNFSQFADYAVYPNPATEYVTIDLSNAINLNTTISISDLSGKKIAQTEFEKAPSSVNMDLNTIPAGQYFIHVATKGKKLITKTITIVK
jgi:Chitobiase/beta-hexosaminidase C-terminal domain/Secretion system C-terminal sorting domain/PA14 domain/Fn3 associated/CotH kinase protein